MEILLIGGIVLLFVFGVYQAIKLEKEHTEMGI